LCKFFGYWENVSWMMIVKGSIEGLTCVILDLNFSCHFGSSPSQAQKHYCEHDMLGQTSDKFQLDPANTWKHVQVQEWCKVLYKWDCIHNMNKLRTWSKVQDYIVKTYIRWRIIIYGK
jgi:hypothetical protein